MVQWRGRRESRNVIDQRFNLLEPGDIDEGMAATAAVGDDTIQRRAGRSVVPDSFTHGSAAQRQRWFMRGFNNPDVSSCDTFSATQFQARRRSRPGGVASAAIRCG